MNWITASDELPEEDGNYLCAFSDGTVESMTFYKSDDHFSEFFSNGKMIHVTHWHPMIPHPDPST